MVGVMVRLIADDASPQKVRASGWFALSALRVRQLMLEREQRLVEAILKWRCRNTGTQP